VIAGPFTDKSGIIDGYAVVKREVKRRGDRMKSAVLRLWVKASFASFA
jgi:hypothetical protein